MIFNSCTYISGSET